MSIRRPIAVLSLGILTLAGCGGGGGGGAGGGAGGGGGSGSLADTRIFVIAGLANAQNVYVANLDGDATRLNSVPLSDVPLPYEAAEVFSADGAWIAWTGNEAAPDRMDAFAVRLSDGVRTNLTTSLDGPLSVSRLRWSPVGALLKLETWDTDAAPDDLARRMAVGEPLTAELRTLVYWGGTATSYSFAWQPGALGSAIERSYFTQSQTYFDAEAINAFGNSVGSFAPPLPAVLEFNDFFPYSAAGGWSPGGHLYGVRGSDAGQERLYTGVPGLVVAPIVTLPVGREFRGAVWAPDGHRIAYVSDELTLGVFESFVVPALGGPSVRVGTGGVNAPVALAVWSPDGAYVHSYRNSDASGISLRSTHVASGTVAVLCPLVSGRRLRLESLLIGELYDPVNGRFALVDESSIGDDPAVYLIDADGSNVAPIDTSAFLTLDDITTRWAPDGEHVLVTFVLDPLGEDVENRIYAKDGTLVGPVWSGPGEFDWSGDGRTFGFIEEDPAIGIETVVLGRPGDPTLGPTIDLPGETTIERVILR